MSWCACRPAARTWVSLASRTLAYVPCSPSLSLPSMSWKPSALLALQGIGLGSAESHLQMSLASVEPAGVSQEMAMQPCLSLLLFRCLQPPAFHLAGYRGSKVMKAVPGRHTSQQDAAEKGRLGVHVPQLVLACSYFISSSSAWPVGPKFQHQVRRQWCYWRN